MAKHRPSTYEVRESNKPFNGKFWRVIGYKGGKRKQHWFDTKAQAERDARDRNLQLANHGTSLELSSFDRADALIAQSMLATYGVNLADAARHYVSLAQIRAASRPLDVFIHEYEAEMTARVGIGPGCLKPGSLKAIKETFRRIEARFGSKLLSDITTKEIESWLLGMTYEDGSKGLSQRSKKRHFTYTMQIFSAAKKKELITMNPVTNVEARLFESEDEEPEILTVEEVRRLLKVACPETKPLFAIAAFAAIRWSEIKKLEWGKHIKLDENEITVIAGTAKTGSRRVVTILPTLAAFLAPYRDGTGSVLPRVYEARRPSTDRFDRLRRKVVKVAGLYPWKQNCLRHSFISYLLAIRQDASYVAYQAGNSPAKTTRHL